MTCPYLVWGMRLKAVERVRSPCRPARIVLSPFLLVSSLQEQVTYKYYRIRFQV